MKCVETNETDNVIGAYGKHRDRCMRYNIRRVYPNILACVTHTHTKLSSNDFDNWFCQFCVINISNCDSIGSFRLNSKSSHLSIEWKQQFFQHLVSSNMKVFIDVIYVIWYTVTKRNSNATYYIILNCKVSFEIKWFKIQTVQRRNINFPNCLRISSVRNKESLSRNGGWNQ